jgi:hypothetical protein
VAFSAGGDADVNPHETGVIGDGLVIAATRILGRAAASVRSSCPARKRRGFLFGLGTLVRFASRLAELHFVVRLGRHAQHALGNLPCHVV